MKNDLTVEITLREDIVKRAEALRGGRALDVRDLETMLLAGLSAMEQVSQACDCADCRAAREQPSPTAMAEFEAVHDQLNRLGQTAESGEARHKNVTLALSETSLVFMAFLDRMYEAYGRGGLRLVEPEIDVNRPADFERAMRYLSRIVVSLLDSEHADFAAGKHPLLFPPLPQVPDGTTIH